MSDAQSSYSHGLASNHGLTSSHTPSERLINTVASRLGAISQLEAVQVVAAIALGVLELASLGICGGPVQHRRAVRMFRYLALLIGLSIILVVAARIPLPEILQ